MKLSTKGRYGLKAMIDLADFSEEAPQSIMCIAQRLSLSDSYLEQLMAKLRKAGLIKSIRGAQGGYVLARDSSGISVGDILRALEGDLKPVDCMGIRGEECKTGECCPSRIVWQKIDESIQSTIDSIYLNELVEDNRRMREEKSEA
ncbi:MAG: Rrf2 family transcriptional regulator [Lachnospiraceae bacterium]|nr:Rrf2 family transcriptional regulator [Lachnospiraceae bacterium]